MTRVIFKDLDILRGKYSFLRIHYETAKLNLPRIMLGYTHVSLPVNLENKTI